METFDKTLDVVSHHAKGSDAPLETLTRPYRKNQDNKKLSELNEANVRCWEESRAKLWFSGICSHVETGAVAS